MFEQLVKQQLGPEEEIIWADKPVPRYFTPMTTAQFAGGIFWLTCLVLILVFGNIGISTMKTWQIALYAAVFVPFFAFGLLLVSSPLWEYRRMKRTIYSITNRRAIVVQNKSKPSVKSYPFDEVTQVRVENKKDNLGDVVIVCGVRVVGESQEDGFHHIRSPQEVASLLERQVAMAAGKEAPEADEAERIKFRGKVPELLVEEKTGKDLTRTILIIAVVLLFIGGLPLLIFRLPAAIPGSSAIGVPAVIFTGLLFLFVLQLRSIFFAFRSPGWPTTEGVVQESYVLAEGDGGYVPKVRYTYRVDGKEYRNNQITTRQRSNTLNRGPAEEIVSRYPEGHLVTVYYHPRKPNYSVLEPGRGAGNWIVLIILAACLMASGLWLVKAW